MSKRKKEEFNIVEYAHSIFEFYKTIDLDKIKQKEKEGNKREK
jgi:hypothetical protein|tara:strand:- start:2155 stop:2283 length:129 start_codon:yes stop_codon:yes gene_type:complete